MSTTSLPPTQRAWVFRKNGHPTATDSGVLKLEQNYRVPPQPKENEVLVKIRAVGLNPIGWKAMSVFPFTSMQSKPATPECEFSGIVLKAGIKVPLQPGEEVFGYADPTLVMKSSWGALAEYAVLDATLIRKTPANISGEEAAALSVGGVTAYRALVTVGGMKKGSGQRVFINGGSGGVGTAAVQLAHAFGAHVTTTCSPASREFMSTHFPYATLIDYKAVKLSNYLASTNAQSPFDIFFDAVGDSRLYYASKAFLKRDGAFVDIVGGAEQKGFTSLLGILAGVVYRTVTAKLFGRVKYCFVRVSITEAGVSEDMDGLVDVLTEGSIKAVIGHTFSFDEALDGYAIQMSGRARGKVVVTVS